MMFVNNFAESADAFMAFPFMHENAVVIGYGSKFIKGAARHPRMVASIVFTAVPLCEIVKFSLKGTVLLGSRNANMKPMSVASANIFVPMPQLHHRTRNVKIKKLAQPKMAQELVGDMPSFIPPGKMPFITHMWKQAQKVPLIPPIALARACPMSGLMVKTNKQITKGILAWIWLGKGCRIAGTQTMEPKRHIITDARTAS